MNTVPMYLPLGFITTVLLSCFFLVKAAKGNKWLGILIISWILVQSSIAATGFYENTQTIPPRFIGLLLPLVILMVTLFLTKKGLKYIDALDTEQLTWLHTVRIPVEICLYLLFTHKLIPELMTFEGINLDIISGITAPVIAYYGYQKKQIPKWVLLIWNFICLGLVINIAYHGILSVPTSFQRFGFEQPNIGLTYFPYMFLPGLIVPMVVFAHLVCIRQLLYNK